VREAARALVPPDRRFAVDFRRAAVVRLRAELLFRRERAELLRAVLRRAVLLRAVLRRAAVFRAGLFRAVVLRAVVLRVVLLRVREDADLRREEALLRRDWPDSDIAIATAWRRLFTRRPEPPLRSFPSLYSCMTFLTLRRCCLLAISASGWKLRTNPETARLRGRSEKSAPSRGTNLRRAVWRPGIDPGARKQATQRQPSTMRGRGGTAA
jgi:hypothetical protein